MTRLLQVSYIYVNNIINNVFIKIEIELASLYSD